MRTPAFLRSLKPPVKRALHSARKGYITRFHSFTPVDFRDLLRSLGVRSGNVVCVHSSFDRFLGFRGNIGDAIKAIQDSVSEDGVMNVSRAVLLADAGPP